MYQSTTVRELYRETETFAASAQGGENREIQLRGWVRTNRGSNKFGFIELNDGTFFKSVQIVYEAGPRHQFPGCLP